MFLIYIAIAIGAAVAWWSMFARRDRFEPEPRRIIIAMFLGGAFLAVPVSAAAEIALDELVPSGVLVIAIAPPVEELAKIGVLLLVLSFQWRQLSQVVDGAIYGVSVGLGFAIVENLGYAAGLGVSVLIVRSLAAPITHALFTGLAGYYLAKAHFSDRGSPSRLMTAGLALLAAIGLHSVWNAPSGLADLASDLFLLLYLLVIPFYVYLLRRFLGRMEAEEAQTVHRLVNVRERKVLASP